MIVQRALPVGVRTTLVSVAQRHGLNPDDLVSGKKGLAESAARREAYAILIRDHSSAVIARWMNRTPDNVMKGARRYRADLASIPQRPRKRLPREVLSLWKGRIDTHPVRRSMPSICAEVASFYGLTVDDLKGQAKHAAVAQPRQHAMWAMSQEAHLSLNMIGAFLGNRDHTTIMFGIRRHEERIKALDEARAAA